LTPAAACPGLVPGFNRAIGVSQRARRFWSVSAAKVGMMSGCMARGTKTSTGAPTSTP
jgi:hypothetical protein